jgi:hypothetical protein
MSRASQATGIPPMTTPADDTPIVPHIKTDTTNTAHTKRTVTVTYTWHGQPIDLELHMRATGHADLIDLILDDAVNGMLERERAG